VCGNKTDLENRTVTREEAQSWCDKNGGYPYIETSAVSSDGVESLFTQTSTRAMENAKKEDDFMPASLSGADGAIKLDRTTDAEATERQTEKKKKKCKC